MAAQNPCSTPSGITARDGSSPTRSSSGSTCAQRLSASRPAMDLRGEHDFRDDPRVLNAFRHHGPRRQRVPDRGAIPRVVLNAFRHHGLRWNPKNYTVGVQRECSTPSGITACDGRGAAEMGDGAEVLNAFRHHGLRRSSRRSASTTAGRAQRLPASRPATGPLARYVRRLHDVHNAFRHHGLRRQRVPDRGAVPRVVLNAFRHPGPRRLRPSPGAVSAVRPRLPRGLRVLNAFRHPGPRRLIDVWNVLRHSPKCSMPSGIPARDGRCGRANGGRRSSVLNAFRHPGPRRYGQYTMVGAAIMCSTPFGITARDGLRELVVLERSHDVLNAFRHPGPRRRQHRQGTGQQLDHVLNAFRHPGPRRGPTHWMPTRPYGVCSTPSGITARDSRRRSRRVRGLHLLNAFRHHGPRRWLRPWAPCSRSTCAQRLPPSRPATVHSWQRVADQVFCMCSTPSGITGPRRRTIKTDILRPGKCSTPSGITARGELILRAPLNRLRECSTPSGITAHDGSRWRSGRRTPVPKSCAQRLPASRPATASRSTRSRTTRSARAQRLPASWPATGHATVLPVELRECSTPHGITARDRSTPTRSSSGSTCAQRLPASRPATVGAVDERRARLQVLNAIRHHGLRRTGRFRRR